LDTLLIAVTFRRFRLKASSSEVYGGPLLSWENQVEMLLLFKENISKKIKTIKEQTRVKSKKINIKTPE